MIRLLGMLVGSALAVAALVMLIGIPRVQTESRHAPIGDNGVIRLTDKTMAVAPEPAPRQEPEPEPAPEAAAAPEAAPAEMPTVQAEPEPQPVEQPPVEFVPTPAATPQWYAFWSPFRTEIAASGFVTQLQRVTGLDYRIVKVETGVYEVAFAYSDDDEIIGNLSQISAATGLQLPEN